MSESIPRTILDDKMNKTNLHVTKIFTYHMKDNMKDKYATETV